MEERSYSIVRILPTITSTDYDRTTDWRELSSVVDELNRDAIESRLEDRWVVI